MPDREPASVDVSAGGMIRIDDVSARPVPHTPLLAEISELTRLLGSYEELCGLISDDGLDEANDLALSDRLHAVQCQLDETVRRVSRLPLATFSDAVIVLAAAERYFLLETEDRPKDAWMLSLTSNILRLSMSLKLDRYVESRRPALSWIGLGGRD